MKKQKMKKIMCEAAAIILVILIIAVNIQAEIKKDLIEYKNSPQPPYNYFIIGKGYIEWMTINGQEKIIGKLEGDLHILNYPGWNSPDYKLYIFDKNTNKLLNKKTLPEECTLKGFIGFGYITYLSLPHAIDATKYFILGKAIDLLE